MNLCFRCNHEIMLLGDTWEHVHENEDNYSDCRCVRIDVLCSPVKENTA